jgi:hypothetical protein
VVRERRGALGRWVGDLDGGLGGLGRPAGQGQRSEWAGWVGKEKKKEIHYKLISRFRKMNKEIRVTEIIGKKSQKFPENCRKFGKARI